mmetsp:Transcript_47924/g.108633  ORF Transcript_47924/g.108633 Transcript_47924/m.108633 type:complete len:338 (-) Transcript_47924:37-1050(-)
MLMPHHVPHRVQLPCRLLAAHRGRQVRPGVQNGNISGCLDVVGIEVHRRVVFPDEAGQGVGRQHAGRFERPLLCLPHEEDRAFLCDLHPGLDTLLFLILLVCLMARRLATIFSAIALHRRQRVDAEGWIALLELHEDAAGGRREGDRAEAAPAIVASHRLDAEAAALAEAPPPARHADADGQRRAGVGAQPEGQACVRWGAACLLRGPGCLRSGQRPQAGRGHGRDLWRPSRAGSDELHAERLHLPQNPLRFPQRRGAAAGRRFGRHQLLRAVAPRRDILKQQARAMAPEAGAATLVQELRLLGVRQALGVQEAAHKVAQVPEVERLGRRGTSHGAC